MNNSNNTLHYFKVFRLSLVRHGQTAHNRSRVLQGQLDTQLDEIGREQASLLARYLAHKGIYFDQVYTSDLSRAYETSRIIVCSCSTNKRCPSIIKRDRLLRERSYGKLQGLPISVIKHIIATNAAATATNATTVNGAPIVASNGTNVATHQVPQNGLNYGPAQLIMTPASLKMTSLSKIHRPEGGETLDEVRARVETFCEQVLFPNAGNQKHILVVSHGGTIREFLRLFRCKYGAQISEKDIMLTPNTGLNQFDIWLTATETHMMPMTNGQAIGPQGLMEVHQIKPVRLHHLPHLTFDVFNRDNNPHVNYHHTSNPMQHLKSAIQVNATDNKDLQKMDRFVVANSSKTTPVGAPLNGNEPSNDLSSSQVTQTDHNHMKMGPTKPLSTVGLVNNNEESQLKVNVASSATVNATNVVA